MAENKTPEAPESPKEAKEKKAPEQKPAKSAENLENSMAKVREEVRQELEKKAKGYEVTPWQSAHNTVIGPAKLAAKVGLLVANPLVYSSVYAADWLAQRTPGVKNLYSTPREIIRSTADRAMNVLVGGATLPVAAPFTLAHEISDRVSGMDTSKPRNAVGWVFDKAGDLIGDGLELVKAAFGKTVELGQKVIPSVLSTAGTAVAAPFKMIGSMYSGLGKIGGITGFVGQLALTAVLVTGGHAAIGASLVAINPAMAATYKGFVDAILQAAGGLL